MVNKQAGIIRVYRPPDPNCLLSVADHCLRSRQYVNVIVVGKQSALQYLSMEEGTTTTPFDVVMLSDVDRLHLVMDVIDGVPGLAQRAAVLRQHMSDERLRHRAYTRQVGDDSPDVRDWSVRRAPRRARRRRPGGR